ncbi:uncharacterized protein [Diadema setosum]|uniref:uncharacterized protein n=1 Tax=Diadema setosum TaxID=31175 RepID=UPI003B3A997A
MAPFPIYCAMLCLMWEEFSKEMRRKMMKMQTFSEIFGAMISFLKEHYASKSCESLKKKDGVEKIREAGRAIQDVSEIALNGLLDKKFSFPEEQFRECGDAMQTCLMVGVLTTEEKVMDRERRQRDNTSSFVESKVSFPHKLFQEYTAGVYIKNLFSNDRPKYEHLKYKLLPRSKEFCNLLYFASSLENKLGLDIIHGLIEKGNQDICIDVAFECHTREVTKAVGERWQEYTLSPNSSEHTNLGVAFMVHCDEVQSLSIQDMTCGRSTSHELAESICSSRVLKHLRIIHSQFHVDFFKILGASDSKCEIQNLTLSTEDSQCHSSMEGDLTKWISSMPRLSSFRVKCGYFEFQGGKTDSTISELTLHFQSSDKDSEYHSSMGGDLARWVCTLPRLWTFNLTCDLWPEKFFSTAADSASSCQISGLTLHFQSSDKDSEYHSSMGGDLARLVCTLPRLWTFNLTCDFWPEKFFSTAADSASSCQASVVNKLQDNLNTLEQYSRRNCLMVFKVPESKSENTTEVVRDIFSRHLGIQHLGIQLKADDIDRSHRIQPRQGLEKSGGNNRRKTPTRPIMVKFITYLTRSQVMPKRRRLKGTGIGIDENLTKQNSQLLQSPKRVQRVKAAWSSDGRILALVPTTNDGTMIRQVHDKEDLNRL